MNEAEWLRAADPQPLLEYLGGRPGSERRVRYFACSVVRRVWHLLTEGDRRAVEVSEKYADGRLGMAELDRAWRDRLHAMRSPDDSDDCLDYARYWAHDAVHWVACPSNYCAASAATSAAWAVVYASEDASDVAWRREREAQAGLLRHVVGIPWRPFVGGADWPQTILGLAEAQYRGDPVAFALHDALAEYGQVEFAAHFREADHQKGCAWLDAILGRW